MSEPRLWFRAKTIGWGWGLPLTWEGWVAYALYAAGFVYATRRWLPQNDIPRFLLATLGLSAALIVLCLFKGEKPGSRSRR